MTKDLDEIDVHSSNGEMVSAAGKRDKKQGYALNEIYGILKEQLSTDDMNKLKN
ncbi:hypothetical protein [Clostridium taeniosporum]|uniref:hypothetical protein n=1 Tax=Clostridium taeniosporum TaxID=394958 RepID=UPI00131463CD|nr:hypothetical protein [Clostridium taeniosporum]